jgi:cytochrome c554/c'-like protein
VRPWAALAVVAVLVGFAAAARAAQPDGCTGCHRGIEDAHPKRPLACDTCHGGDRRATTALAAHRDMARNPSDLRVVDRSCGQGGCHRAITQAVKASIMAHRSGTQSGTRFPNGLQPTREATRFAMTPTAVHPAPWARGVAAPGAVAGLDPLPTFAESGDLFFDLLRKECTSCHLWTAPKAIRGNFRATGCAACHMPYGEDGRSRSGDVAMPTAKVGRPLRHVLTRAVPVSQCATCHNGGSRAAMNFRGLMEAPPEGRDTFRYDQDLLHGHAYTPQTPDVHFEHGLGCIDCHTEKEMHGDGFVYAKRQYYVEVRCESCHGTPGALATGRTARGRPLNNVFVAAAPNRAGVVTLVSKLTGRLHAIPQLATSGSTPGHSRGHLGTTECFTCHTAWAPTCYGCHIKMDFTAYRNPVDVSFDHLAGAHAKQGWFRLTAGLRLADPEPVLGISWRGKVVPFVPRAQPLFSLVNPAGQLEYDFRKLGFAHNPIVPHTVVREARSCASCHANPRALGLGEIATRDHPKLGEFRQPPGFLWDRIVDEAGTPLQVTTVDGARPFTAEEMERIRSAPFKVPSTYDSR